MPHVTAENDVLRDEGEAYGHKLIEAGVEVVTTRYNATIHDFVMLNGLAEAAGASLRMPGPRKRVRPSENLRLASLPRAHTEVPEKLRGMGLASSLAETALDWARENNLKVDIICPLGRLFMP